MLDGPCTKHKAEHDIVYCSLNESQISREAFVMAIVVKYGKRAFIGVEHAERIEILKELNKERF